METQASGSTDSCLHNPCCKLFLTSSMKYRSMLGVASWAAGNRYICVHEGPLTRPRHPPLVIMRLTYSAYLQVSSQAVQARMDVGNSSHALLILHNTVSAMGVIFSCHVSRALSNGHDAKHYVDCKTLHGAAQLQAWSSSGPSNTLLTKQLTQLPTQSVMTMSVFPGLAARLCPRWEQCPARRLLEV